jgi:Tfp pilus assembly protein FimT
MSKSIEKQQAALEALLEQKCELEREANTIWQQVRMARTAAIRGGADPGPLPAFVGLDEQWRAGQQRQEQLAYQHREADEAVARDPYMRHQEGAA